MNKIEYEQKLITYDDLFTDMETSLANKSGWSMIRISDGEGQLLKSVRLRKPIGCVADKNWRTKFLPVSDWMTVGQKLIQGIKKANFIGLPRWFEMSGRIDFDLHNELPKHDINIDNLRLTDSWAGCAIRYKENIIKSLCQRYRIGIVYHNINRAQSVFNNEYKTKNLIIFPYNKTTNDDEILNYILQSGRELIFISGGPKGKILNTRIAQNKLVAYDLGQAIELSYDWIKNLFERRSTWIQK